MPTTTRPDLTAAALVSLVAAAVSLAVWISEPFEHGAWLVAYLFLVGFLAQILLGRGQAALLSAAGLPTPTRGVRLAQALPWNLGVIAVPAGVLAETRLTVVVGSVSLLTALAFFAKTALPEPPCPAVRPDTVGWAYALLLLVMTASTLIGTALAWDIPWT